MKNTLCLLILTALFSCQQNDKNSALDSGAGRAPTTDPSVKEYCEDKNAVKDPAGILACVDKAYAGPFSKDESIRICTGAHNDKPAVCAMKAYAGPFAKAESIQLCILARGNGPVDCAIKAYAGPFTRAESLALCEQRTVANADCAIKAYSGNYTRQEALQLCSAEISCP